MADRSATPLIQIGRAAGNITSALASLDGRRIAITTYEYGSPALSRDLHISVFDAPTGELRSRFSPEVPVVVDDLSADGTRIYARTWPPRDASAERLVLDATNGKIIEREPAFAVRGDTIASTTDRLIRREYRLIGQADPNATAPRSVDVAAWDLRTGNELWRTSVPSLLAGEWRTGRIVDGVELRSRIAPALALRADGDQLAIVGGSADTIRTGAIWIIQAQTGRLVSQRSYSVASLLDRIFAPSVAAAKSLDESLTVNAMFSLDGQTLYAHARRTTVDEGGQERYLYLGMVAVAVSEAIVRGHDIKMETYWYENRIAWTRASADGKWLYIFLERSRNAVPLGYFLRRVDASTLRVLSERPFDGHRHAFMLAPR
ncbi:MAG TPA: hypothetical protein VJP45_12465 [Candidatus Limnocylindria bacterium]|nr:hypothetical protein [Candidatus Limnocylindria bacterium]